MVTNEEMAARIVAAMDWREPCIPSALVAKRCEVTPQAVSKWRRTGKINMREHLPRLAAVTQVPLMFYIEERRGDSPETKTIWRRLRAFAATPAALAFFALLPSLNVLNPLLDLVNCVLCQIDVNLHAESRIPDAVA